MSLGLAGAVAFEWNEETEEVEMTEGPHEDLFGHGTACAGIIKMVAPRCELYSVRVLGQNLSGKGAVFAAGLRWAIDHSAPRIDPGAPSPWTRASASTT